MPAAQAPAPEPRPLQLQTQPQPWDDHRMEVILGNLLAVIFGGLLNFFEIHVRRSGPDLGSSLESLAGNRAVAPAVVNKTGGPGIVAAVAVIGVLYLSGLASSLGLGLPAPLVVLALAAIMQASNLLTADLRRGVQAVYRLCVRFLTYPLLFIVGLLLTPWDKLVAGFSPIYLSTIGAVVTTLAVTGYVVSRWAKIRGVEGAIVVLSRAAMGGTGDIAILTAARRLQLMPFAQIATRIGGAATVALALIGVEHFGI